MISELEALYALQAHGTMTRAANALRLSQSAISKRIAALEAIVDERLVEPQGRGVRLTVAALGLIDRTQGLVAELRQALTIPGSTLGGKLVIGVSESILASWGAPALTAFAESADDVDLVLHAHRSPVAIERVRAGEYHLALVAGTPTASSPGLGSELVDEVIGEEAMAIVPCGLVRFRWRRPQDYSCFGIERRAATARSLAPGLRLLREDGWRITIERELESYACIVQLARSGAAHGLVPRGLATSMGIRDAELIALPRPGLRRPIRLLGRASSVSLPPAIRLRQHLREFAVTLR